MTFTDRVLAVKGKIRFYGDEVLALKNGGIRYAVFFTPLLVLLFPVLVIEIFVLLAFGVDAEINRTRELEIPSELSEDEVPFGLRQLIPFARKWGIGDAEGRGAGDINQEFIVIRTHRYTAKGGATNAGDC